MNKKKSIEILKSQKAKIDDPNHKNDTNWVFQTASYIKDFFGKDSTEYDFIRNFQFEVNYSVYDSPDIILREIKEKNDQAKRFIDNCIETINQKGLTKGNEGNFLQKFNDTWLSTLLVLLLTTVATVSFMLGKYISNVENFSLKKENEELQSILKNNGIQSNSEDRSINFNHKDTIEVNSYPIIENEREPNRIKNNISNNSHKPITIPDSSNQINKIDKK
jgi:hypothetical protein